MRIKKTYIHGMLLLALMFFLMAFADRRNSKRVLSEVSVYFTNNENLYITADSVDNLFIQNKVVAQSIGKESLDLSKLEAMLDKHDMIENSEVYLSVDGKLGALITQRQPIARVMGNTSYYIDRNGIHMPLSKSHSARVPLITGLDQDQIEEVFPLLEYITKDDFLRKQITSIHRNYDGSYDARIREFDFVVSLGRVTEMERKFSNFKAFYQKAMKDQKLDAYSRVNLRFGNQVVSTKK